MKEQSFVKVLGKAVVCMVVVALAGYFLFNGFGSYSLEREGLEREFRSRAAEAGVKSGGEETLILEEFGGSVNFLMTAEDGERACGTYRRSLFSDKFRETAFYSGRNGVLGADDFSYKVNDGTTMYMLTCHFGEEPSIELSGGVTPVLSYKFVGICVMAMGVFGSRIFFAKKKY